MGYSRKEVYGTTPLDYKNMNDNFKYVWLKVFGNMTDSDLANDANINGSKIKANSITANQIAAGTITADEIDVSTLYVGTGGIRLDPSATISWGQINDPPSYDSYTDQEALDAWAASGYATHIDANGIYTGALVAQQITALGTIQGLHFQTAANSVKRFVADGANCGVFGSDNQGRLCLITDASENPTLYFGGTVSSIQSTGALWISAPSIKANNYDVLTTASSIIAKFA